MWFAIALSYRWGLRLVRPSASYFLPTTPEKYRLSKIPAQSFGENDILVATVSLL